MAVKNYYQLLGVVAAASADDVKRAFRQQIARYHPDKVQHLGQEFQDMAADRAAELTEAYRILSNEGLRQEYDRNREIAAPARAADGGPPVRRPPGPRPRRDPAPESSPSAADPLVRTPRPVHA